MRHVLKGASIIGMGLILLVAVAGCRSHQLRRDQDHMREAVLELYTNQIMDNLIRVYNGMPIVQMDYTSMTGTLTQDLNASIGDQQTLQTEANQFGVTTLRKFVSFWAFGVGGDNKMQLTITGNPVVNNNEVYNAYIEFVFKEGQFMVTRDPPAPGEAHIVRCSRMGSCQGELYYWVPREHMYDFLRLALVTTVQRGQPLSTPDFFENTIARVEDSTPDTFDENMKRRFTIYLKKRIPNGGGKMSVTLDNEPYELSLNEYTDKIDGEMVKRGNKIDRLWLVVPLWNGKVVRREDPEGIVVGKFTPGDFRAVLEGQAVRIDLNYYKPTIPSTEDLLKDIRHEVGLLRLEQAGR